MWQNTAAWLAALYSAAGHGLYTQFTRPLSIFAEVHLAHKTSIYLWGFNKLLDDVINQDTVALVMFATGIRAKPAVNQLIACKSFNLKVVVQPCQVCVSWKRNEGVLVVQPRRFLRGWKSHQHRLLALFPLGFLSFWFACCKELQKHCNSLAK